MVPGEYLLQRGEIELNAGRPRERLRVENTGDRPIQVGSHAHFFEVNRALRFDRARAYGRRLDIAAGTSLRFEPGEARDVTLIPLAGLRVAFGMSGQVNGPLDARSPNRDSGPTSPQGGSGDAGKASTR
jgi:urease subunit beta